MGNWWIYLWCFLGTALCNWTSPVLVQPSTGSYVSNLLLGPSNDFISFFLKNGSICYKSIKNYIPQAESCISQSLPIQDFSVVSLSDRTEIFIAYEAKRTIAGKQCADNDTSGCLDVYYISSSDLGKTWSSPQQVPRRNLNDVANRTTPKVLYINETGRIFIFYCLSQDDLNYVYKVDKPASSGIFSQEAKIYQSRYSLHKLKVQYARTDSITIYMCIENLYWFYMIATNDNGVTWSEPKGIRFIGTSLEYTLTKPLNDGRVLITICSLQLLTVHLLDKGAVIDDYWFHLGEEKDYKPFVSVLPDDPMRYIVAGKREKKEFSTHVYYVEKHLLTDLRIGGPANITGDVIVTNEDAYRMSVLHYVNGTLYLSTLTLPKV